MATKPGTVPPIWAPSATYTTGPFIGLSNKAVPAGAVGTDGHRPGSANPTPAEYPNYTLHWTTAWVKDWLSQGLAVAAGNTHIVETDANGRTEVVGLDITDAVDRTVADFQCANTAVPAMIINTPGNGLQVECTGGGTASYTADMTGGNAIGFQALDAPADAATALSIFLNGNNGGLGTIRSDGTNASGLTVRLTSSPNDTLYLLNGGNGSPLRSEPQTPPAILLPGQQWPDVLDNDFQGVRPSGARTRFWSSSEGYNTTFSELAVPAAAGATYLSFNYGFVAGKTYIIDYGFDFGRTVGSSRHALDYFNIGGVYFPAWFAAQLDLFQGGAWQIEKSRAKRWVFTSPVTAVMLVDLFVGSTAGAGTVQIANGYINLIGALD